MNIEKRREALNTIVNPENKVDFIVSTSHHFSNSILNINGLANIYYIPDKYILAADSIQNYLNLLENEKILTLEELASAILFDLNNEIVARWTQVNLIKSNKNKNLNINATHIVTIEDHQPNWDNFKILSRIPRFS